MLRKKRINHTENGGLYCPISRVSSGDRQWYSIRFGIGKMGRTSSYDNVSKLAFLMLNKADCQEIIEPLTELKQYKNKSVRLTFSFHPWRRQSDDGMLKFININKAFAPYINELHFRPTLTVSVSDEIFEELFKILKYNSLHHKLSYICLDLFSGNKYYEIMNKCLTKYIFTINHIEYEQNKNNNFSKFTMDLKDFFGFSHDIDIEQSIARFINFNVYLGNTSILRDLHCYFSITDIIKYRSNTMMKAFFDGLYKNQHILSVKIEFSSVWWSTMKQDIKILHEIFTTFWNGFYKFIENRKLIKTEANANKYISHDFNDMKIMEIFPLIPLNININMPEIKNFNVNEDAYKILRDGDNLAQLFDKIGANKDIILYKLKLNQIVFNENCLESLLQNVFIAKVHNNTMNELSLIGKSHFVDKNGMKSFVKLLKYLSNNKNNTNISVLTLGVFSMQKKEIETELLSLIKNVKSYKIHIQFEDLFFDKIKKYFAAYFEALYNVMKESKIMIETLKKLSIPNEIICLILNYSKYRQFDLEIRQPVKVINVTNGVRYEHNWKDMQQYQVHLKKIITENVNKLISYFDKMIDDHKDIYHDFKSNLNVKSTSKLSSKFRKYMKLIFEKGTDVHIQSFSLLWNLD